MGAVSAFFVLNGNYTDHEVECIFYGKASQIAKTPYDGNWSTLNIGSIDVYDHLFEEVSKAEDFILDNSEKWYKAAAAKVKNYQSEHGEAPPDDNGYVWLIGGWLAV